MSNNNNITTCVMNFVDLGPTDTALAMAALIPIVYSALIAAISYCIISKCINKKKKRMQQQQQPLSDASSSNSTIEQSRSLLSNRK